MALLSKELTGVILPHEHYGTHLDNSGKTIDEKKEIDNFAYAGETLAEVWSNNLIDGYNVVGEYIRPECSEVEESHLLKKDMKWEDIHVRTSQYFLQITKCSDRKCCSNPRSSIFEILKDRFLPPPCRISQNDTGLGISEEDGKFPSLFASEIFKQTLYMEKFPQYDEIPYDIACPSVKQNLERKICIKCGLYLACLNKLGKHKKSCGQQTPFPKIRSVRVAAKRQRELLAAIIENENEETWEWIDEDLVEPNVEISKQKEVDQAPLITMDEHFSTPWIQI